MFRSMSPRMEHEMKLCKDCAHFRAPIGNLDASEYANCLSGMQTSPVTGATDLPGQSSRFCLTLRRSDKAGDCGSDAKQFKSRQLASIQMGHLS